ncbi:hypothetical protein GGD68_006276 [Paraburkholderia fungorum]|uniref:Uncharacterized protein n=1 Tax=Paraburkholderia fungorum TaxID=134537 RepID=A0AAW3V5S1_9BURK|nr:hypothetical protein [Paraburkholderia fungorum]MBB6204541.1 hypothetical protein [Paraburkholderia fungorum]
MVGTAGVSLPGAPQKLLCSFATHRKNILYVHDIDTRMR